MNINRIVDISVGMCYELVLRDDIWKAFGFNERPKRGAYFQFSVPSKKRSAEKFLIEELTMINFVLIIKALYVNFHSSQEHMEHFEWKSRGATNEGTIAAGIMDRMWSHRMFKNLDTFINSIKNSALHYKTYDFDQNFEYFSSRFKSLDTSIPPSIIDFGTFYLFKGSDFARGIDAKLNEYKSFFLDNKPEEVLQFNLNEKEGRKIIECSISILEIPD